MKLSDENREIVRILIRGFKMIVALLEKLEKE